MKQILLSLKLRSSSTIMLLLLLMSSAVFGQTPTISSVVHTIVTKNTQITINGNNFGASNTIVTVGGASAGPNTFTKILNTNNQLVLSVSNATTAIPINGAIKVTRAANPGSGLNVTSSQLISYRTPVVKNATTGNRIDRIYTDYNNFWTSGVTGDVSTPYSGTNNVKPDNRHNLLGFKFNGTVYSTGVNNQRLTDNGVAFNSQDYRAYSTRGVEGLTNASLFLAMADLIDGSTNTVGSSPEIQGLGIFDVLIDGEHGLDLGTGVTNFNTAASISFFSDNAQDGGGTAFADNVPEVLITQVAQAGNTDFYHFSDVNGNIVGNPVQMDMNSIARLGAYTLDLFNFPNNANIATSVTNGTTSFGTSEERDIRLVGLRFNDFGINASNFAQIESFDMLAGGTADVAFLAYNTASFQIASPIITSTPNSVRLCSLPYAGDVTFSVGAAIQGGAPGTLNYQWKKNNIDIPGATSSSYTITGPITAAKLATYKVEISNTFGAIVASSAVLRQGGAQVVWNGSNWSATPTNSNSLVFNGNYDSATNLGAGTKIEGCDCKVQNGANVVIDSGDALILQNSIEVALAVPAYTIPSYVDGNGDTIPAQNVPAQPAGTFTLRDDASLIQVSESADNIGVITKKRKATNLHQWDYVYWSSPVDGFSVSSLVPYSTLAYRWNPTLLNPNASFGNWTAASGTMAAATGYISRVNSASDFEVSFVGAPHNGVYTFPLSGNTNAAAGTNYWNLVGNPYPSSIKAIDFITSNVDIEGNIRIWTHQAPISNATGNNPFYNNFTYNYGDQYLTYNGTGSVPAGFNGNIASGQGFFVQGTSTTGTVTFQNTFRYKETLPVYNNSQFYRTSAQAQDVSSELPEIADESQKSIVWLSLVNSANSSVNTAVGYVPGATMAKDRVYDASTEAGTFSVYSLVGQDPVIIQGRSWPFDNTDTVPVGFAVPSTGIYNIAINQVKGVFEDASQGIYLKDTYLDITHDLRIAPYTFTALQGNFTDRFVLQYQTSALSVGDEQSNGTFAFINNQTLQVQASAEIKNIEIYDLSGKHVTTYTIADHGNRFDTPFSFATGFYLAKINLANGISVTQKVITD